MGFGMSKPVFAQSITREQLLKSTENPRDFTNKLFQVMITKLTPEDFLKLGNPKTCKEYVFLMADSIANLFDDLRIRPTKGKDSGIVLFQKISKLQTESSINKELCLVISYFYIRIFQIFGALAMTVLDDPAAGAVLGAVRYAPQPIQRVQQGFFGQQKRIPGMRGALLTGGSSQIGGANKIEFTGNAREFAPMSNLFNDPIYEKNGIGIDRKVFSFIDEPTIEYIPDRKKNDGSGKSQNLRIRLADDLLLYGNIQLRPVSTSTSISQYNIVFNTISIYSTTTYRELLSTVNKVLLQYNTIIPVYKVTISAQESRWIVNETTDFIDKFKEIVDRIKERIQKILESPKEYTEKVSRDIVFERGIPKVVDKLTDKLDSRIGATDIGIPKALQNQYIIATMKAASGQVPVAFCIARAFQLLDANAHFEKGLQQAKSGICMARFSELPKSVPYDGKISEIPGMKALDQLYYTKPSTDGRIDVSDPAEYSAFLSSLGNIFASSDSKQFEKIAAKQPCSGNEVNKYLQIQDKAKLEEILSISRELFKKQFDHTKRVIQFFNSRLFLIRKSSGSSAPLIDIHPKLLQGGIEELKNVSKEARTILNEYYKGCEETYQKGVKAVLSSTRVPV